MKKVYIFGNNSIAELLKLYLSESGVEIGGKVLNKEYADKINLETNEKIKAIEDVIETEGPENILVYISVGNTDLNRARQRIMEYLASNRVEIGTFIHPSACVSSKAEIGAGSIIMERVVVQPFAKIGSGTIIWPGCLITHDCQIGKCNYIAAGATICGRVQIADRCFIGANATLREEIRIGSECIIGAGSFINTNVKPNKVIAAPKANTLPLSSEDLSGLT